MMKNLCKLYGLRKAQSVSLKLVARVKGLHSFCFPRDADTYEMIYAECRKGSRCIVVVLKPGAPFALHVD